MKKRTKKLLLLASSASLLFLLTGCGTGEVTANTTDIWSRIVWFFGQAIQFFSIRGNIGVGIIVFTLVIRIILFPLMHFQAKSMRKTQELQPEIKKIQAQYPGKDSASRRNVQEATQRLYAENKVNPYVGCLPMLVQMPVLMGVFQALQRIPALQQGHFLWMNLGNPDQLFILPILAALFTFASSWLSMKAAIEENSMTKMMTFVMPVMIFFFAFTAASGVSLYWVVSNAFQVLQTMMTNNPFKIQRERAEKIQAEKDAEKNKQRALKKAMKKRK